MASNLDFELLKDEKVEASLKPHPLSFIKYYLICLYLAFLAVALQMFYRWLHQNFWLNPSVSSFLNLIASFAPNMNLENLFSLIIFWLVLAASGLLIGVLWISKMPLLYMVLIGVVGTLTEVYLFPTPITKLAILLFSAVIGLVLVEFYRRGHKYFLTSYRVIMVKKFIGKEVREIMYDKISDVYIGQSLLGRIFNYGTIIPISESGLGLGEDASLAALSTGVSAKGGTLGAIFGGKKGVSKPRAATYFSLHGVKNPRRVRGIIASKILEMKEAPILRRIEDILKEKRDETPEESEKK